MGDSYEERASRLHGAKVWSLTVEPGTVHPVLPDGCMDLLWSGERLLVAGPDTRTAPATGTGGSWAGIRFAPGAAPALLGVPADALRDLRVPLAALWPGHSVRRLTERVAEAAEPAAALEDIALDRAARTEPPDPVMRAVAARLEAGGSVADAAHSAGLGTRQLHRRSLTAFGYGPKTLARVLRLQRALALVRSGLPYADAALAAGCADQAHLARDMRDLAGTTLTAYFGRP
ncbi:helix-turn-helix domain-containing protein [Streptomyces sp. NBC_01789]|uniref:helix-turn-helix domain-containing protein n=1 Tax=Streptomyces sp. NBC_01789 TaxID=2975941 RepID=UPI002B1CAA14|nr:helix-turn-helix domain-containing protein [Streptomyces sp. NBC_01789]